MADTLTSTDAPQVSGMVVLNPDGTKVGGTVTVDPTGLATDSNQTDGSQKTQIVDAGGEAATVTGGKLDVNATASLSGDSVPVSGATSAVSVQVVDGSGDQISSFGGGIQYTEGDTDATITGTALMWEDADNTMATVTAANPLPVSASIDTTGLALAANQQTDALTDTELRATPVPISGSVTADLGANNDVTVTGSVTANAGTNLNTSALLTTSAHDAAFGTAGTADAQVRSVQGVASMTPLLVDATGQGDVPVTLGGESVTVDLGANNDVTVTSGAITETNSGAIKTALETAGGLVVNLGANNDVTVTGSVTADLGANNDVTMATLPDTAAGDLAAIVTALDGSLHVAQSGTWGVTAALSATDNAVLDSIDSAVNGTLTVGSHAVTNAGTFATQATLQTGSNQIGHLEANQSVNVAQMNGVTTTMGNGTSGTGVQRVTIASDSTGQVKLAAGTAAIGKLTSNSGVDIGDVTINNSTGASAVNIQDGGNTITVDGTVTANLSSTDNTVLDNIEAGIDELKTGVVLQAGTNGIGKLTANSGVDIGDVDVTSISAGSNLIGDVSLQPRTGNGLTIFRSIDLDETEEEIKGSAGNLYGYFAFNAASTTLYIKFYNATAANVTVGTTTPVLTLPLPAGAAANISFAYPIGFDTAITAAATTGIADNDTGAPGANEVTLNAFYK